MKRWLTFDLDGTLMQNPFTKWVFPEIETVVLAECDEWFDVTRALLVEHKYRLRMEPLVDAYDWDDILQVVLKRRGVTLELSVVELVKKHAVPPKVFLLEEGIIELLTLLNKNNYSLAAITNGFLSFQRPVMDVLGLTDCFDEIVTPDQTGCAKPDQRVFERLKESGIVVAHVGDRLDHDVQLAYREGIASVLIYRELPEDMNILSPSGRVLDERFLALCREKWLSETGLPIKYNEGLLQCVTPKLVIRSLHELLHALQQLSDLQKNAFLRLLEP